MCSWPNESSDLPAHRCLYIAMNITVQLCNMCQWIGLQWRWLHSLHTRLCFVLVGPVTGTRSVCSKWTMKLLPGESPFNTQSPSRIVIDKTHFTLHSLPCPIGQPQCTGHWNLSGERSILFTSLMSFRLSRCMSLITTSWGESDHVTVT